ncbi:MAG: copper-binding protein [Terracidiphilus sp.]
MRRLLVSTLLTLIVLAGCHSEQKPTSQPTSAPNQNIAIGEFERQVYHLRGKVVSTDAAKGEVTLNHEAIPGYMEAMTMPYKLQDASILGELHPGDVITADVIVMTHPDGETLLDNIVVVAQARSEQFKK